MGRPAIVSETETELTDLCARRNVRRSLGWVSGVIHMMQGICRQKESILTIISDVKTTAHILRAF
jgi:hypothetical protein